MKLARCPGCGRLRIVVRVSTRPQWRKHQPCGAQLVPEGTPVRDYGELLRARVP